MDLIVVESPTKSKTLSKFLPAKDFTVEASVGHIRDLPKSKLGVDVDNNFEPVWETVKGKQSVIKKIKTAGMKAERILLASDPDREGEAIAWHVYEILKKDRKFPLSKKKVVRITFHEITKEAILEAIKKGGKLNENLFDAQQARRVLDRLVGYKLSPVLWRKIRRGLSAGRVQSVAVRLIVEREKEREEFKPEEYWEVVAELNPHQNPGGANRSDNFYADLVKTNNQPTKIETEKQAMETMAELDTASYQVGQVIKKESRSRPAPPFTTSKLQQTASNKLGWSAKHTMRVAQSLYEKGLITYHRTDSLNIAEKALKAARTFIKKEYGDKYLPEKSRHYKTKAKVAQEAHEAIRPTKIDKKPDNTSLNSKLQDGDQKLYKLIWQRFMASQMASAVYDRTKITIKATPRLDNSQSKKSVNIYTLQTQGKIRKFDGWLKAYGRNAHDEQLPDIQAGKTLQLIEVDGEQRFTEPPTRYSEATLIKKMEDLGIGRPSTYAPTIATIQARGYVEKIDNRLVPTAVGVTTNNFLVKYFPSELDYDFTAKMEDSLDDIANGEKQWAPVIQEFYQPFIKAVAKAEKAEREAVPVEKTGKQCPDCLAEYEKKAIKKSEIGELVVRTGKFGKFVSCSRFPDCKYTANYQETIGVECPECGLKEGGEVVVRRSKKRKRTFYGCSRWPDCKWVSWNDPRKQS